MNNNLFQKAFDSTVWKNEDKLSYLKENINSIERIITNYLEKITNDFPQLTDHSLDHSKKLWDYANIIIGEDKQFINPLEAFVLHLSFLTHDSGMCYSILNNEDEVRKDTLYLDYIKQYGNTDEVQRDALFCVVRARHGDFAFRVATQRLSNDEYLISDEFLREEFGEFIGKIAKSHTENINYIEREFGSRYCSPKFPSDWSIDCKKLSLILRVADAAHIDNLRTPKSRKLISEIEGVSKEHWTFQKKLGFPILSDDLLEYTTNTPFSEKEQKAWWFCYDALLTLDRELKNANEFFEAKKQMSFAAKGVKSINNTLELGKKYIKTEGWDTIDTTIRVSNPVHIATELGGIKLYGHINFAVRELVQNSIDAINLHRIYTGQKDNLNVGEITITVEKENDDFFLIVTDNGIGMSQSLLTNELLDFGNSYWKSNKFKYDFQGVNHNGFESIGKFGIGFFSVFMLGQQITVTSWKYGESIDNMKTLDFFDGINSNPILRNPNQAEKNRIIDKGTSIRIKLYEDPYLIKGFIGNSYFQNNTLSSLIKYFAPSSNVKITTIELDKTVTSIPPNYMYNLPFDKLIDYIYLPKIIQQNELDYPVNTLKNNGIDLIEICSNGENLGKLVMLPPRLSYYQIKIFAVVISNGIRVKELTGFAGYILTNDIVSIKRDTYTKLISYDDLKEWAIKQKEMIESKGLESLYEMSYFNLLMTFDMYDENLPILFTKTNNQYVRVTIQDFENRIRSVSEIKIYFEGHYNKKPDCDGFICIQDSFHAYEILKDEDMSKLIKYDDIIRNSIKKEWGSFHEKNEELTGNPFEQSYYSIKIYEKEEKL
jgi:hypothetical protein